MKAETEQLSRWQGEFGREYTDRNSLNPEDVDALWIRNYGISRSELNREFLAEIPKDEKILEVGCNIANQLVLLQRQGFTNLYGIEAQEYALEATRPNVSRLNLIRATAFDIPYKDNFFELVFTAGVLIHIAPEDLLRALAEIHRCTGRYIWGAEYYAPSMTEVRYRGHEALMWKTDFAREYLRMFGDLELVMERRLPYLENENVDSMFLLRKRDQAGPR
jgi:pseudaminic acid biosynthesis-associated methylase